MCIYKFFLSFLLSLFSTLLQSLLSIRFSAYEGGFCYYSLKTDILIIHYILICNTWCSTAGECFINNVSFQRQIVTYRVMLSLEQTSELFSREKKNDKGNEISNTAFKINYKHFKFKILETLLNKFSFWIYFLFHLYSVS